MKQSKSNEWVVLCKDKKIARVGITKFASNELGDIVFVELPILGESVKAGDAVAVLESTKAAADCYTPVSGKVTKINVAIAEKPELIGEDPQGDGWLYEVEISDTSDYDDLEDLE